MSQFKNIFTPLEEGGDATAQQQQQPRVEKKQ
jgi:hypothetical protein